jgi:hypothetical protein
LQQVEAAIDVQETGTIVWGKGQHLVELRDGLLEVPLEIALPSLMISLNQLPLLLQNRLSMYSNGQLLLALGIPSG